MYMRNHFSTRTLFAPAGLLAALLLLADVTPGAQSRPRFFSDDPIVREPETQDASKTQEWEIGLISDLTLNLFAKPGDPTLGVRAQNVNTIDEVPDSSWFTNRIYTKPVTVDEITRGPNTMEGPAAGKWTIIRAKTAGTAPGFTVRDEKGGVWFLSMDADGYPVAATAAIAVASRLFWALGYNVPESHLTTFRPENIVDWRQGDDSIARAQAPVHQQGCRGRVRARESKRRRLVSRAGAARPPRQGRSAASSTTVPAPTIRTTSSRMSIAASCARCRCSADGRTWST